jgi:pyrroline-5-carboxylate reductase
MKIGTGVTATVFLGGGRITAALVAGLRLAKYDQPIIVHDRHLGKLRQLEKQYDVVVEPNLRRALEQAGLLVIAVRPDSVSDLLQEVGKIARGKPELRKLNRLLTAVSLAAGVPLAKLRARLGPPVRWARAMPSAALGADLQP